MAFKTIFIIVLSVLVTIILMNNTEEIHFWIFGDARIPKLAVLGVMFGLGLIIGFLAGRPRKKMAAAPISDTKPMLDNKQNEAEIESRDYLSDEDRDYIK